MDPIQASNFEIKISRHKLQHWNSRQMEALFPYDEYYCAKCKKEFDVWRGTGIVARINHLKYCLYTNDANKLYVRNLDYGIEEEWEKSEFNICPITDDEAIVKDIIE